MRQRLASQESIPFRLREDSPGFPQSPGLGAVVARAARHAQRQGTRPCRSVRLWIWVRKPPPLRPSAGSVAAFSGAPAALACARTVLSSRTADDLDQPACRPSGAARRPDRTHGRSGDRRVRFPYAAGRRQGTPDCAIPHSAVRKDDTTFCCCLYTDISL